LRSQPRTFSGIARDFWDDAQWPDDDDDDYLIEGLLSSSMTVFAGSPGAGKTHLAVGMGAALLNGEPEFLGQEVRKQIRSVAFICTDPKSDRATRRRLKGLLGEGARGSKISVLQFTPDLIAWRDLCRLIVAEDFDLVIVDNVLGTLEPGVSVNEDIAARAYMAELGRISETGTAVLYITHNGKPGANGPAQGVDAAIGSRYWTVPARCKGTLTFNERTNTRTLTVKNNDSEPIRVEATLSVDDYSPIWSKKESVKAVDAVERPARVNAKRERGWAPALVDTILAESHTFRSMRDLAAHYAPRVNKSPETVRGTLARMGVTLKSGKPVQPG
jgi:hypothetical protein